ncbi:MAG: hypothetical protein WAM82_22915 [Thermoanaerobaculia bacterium]
MKIPVLIGVGGTGQMVLAAYLRLAEMAGFTPATFYVVDSDTEGPLGRVLATLKGRVKEVVGGKEPPLRWMIDPFPIADADRKTFGSLFGNLAGDRRELFNCLFSEEAEHTPIRTGMYGRPAIGATCIQYKIQQDDEDMKDLKNALRGGEKHVILVGSCFGGTGSGGVPMLASELSRLNGQPGYNLQVDAMIFLPWFRLIPPEGGVKASQAKLHDYLNANFEPNAAAGIYYFRERLRQFVNTVFLLGVPDPGQVDRTSSESSQDEVPHILNLLAALLVQNHFAGALSPPQGIAGYWYDDESGLNASNLLVNREANADPLSLIKVIHRSYVRGHWLGILSKFFRKFPRLPGSHQPILIQTAINMLKGSTLTDNQVTAAVADYLGKLQGQSTANVDWIKKMNHPHFFPFPEGAERVLAERYDQTVAEPLAAIQDWCDDRHVVAQFPKRDLRTPEAFAERFSNLFLSHLAQVFSL